MSSLEDKIKTLHQRAAREEREATKAEIKAVTDKFTKAEKKKAQQREGFGGRGREIAAIERHRLIAINLKSAPFEWLSSKGYLESRADKPGIGNIRFSAGMQFRDLLVGAEPMELRSANLEGRSGGSGTPMIINDHKMDCLTALNALKADLVRAQPKRWGRLKMPTGVDRKGQPRKAWIAEIYKDDRPVLFWLLEKLIYSDVWIFDGMTVIKKKAVMEQLHYGLDLVAVFFGMMTAAEFSLRWGQALQKTYGKAQKR